MLLGHLRLSVLCRGILGALMLVMLLGLLILVMLLGIFGTAFFPVQVADDEDVSEKGTEDVGSKCQIS